MSEAYSESDAYVAGLTLPVDTELATMATLKPVLTRIADRTKYFLSRERAAAAAYVQVVPLTAGQPQYTGSEWTLTAAGGSSCAWSQANGAAGQWLRFGLDLPRANTLFKITEVKCYFTPVGGHGGFTIVQPSIRLVRQPLVGGALTNIASATLAAASLVAYEAPQTLTITPGGGHVVLATDTYYMEFRGESGANAAAGLQIFGLTVTTEPS